MFEDDLLCACGCGLRVSNKKRKQGGIYYNIVHANRHKGLLSIGKKKGHYKKKKIYPSQQVYELKMDINDRYYYDGKSKCLNYNDDDIKCVMCFEEELYMKKSCRVKPPRKRRKNVEP